MSVNIKEIAEYVGSCENMSKIAVERMLNGAFGYIKDALANGQEVTIQNFGKFVAENKAARKGRNLSTGAQIEIPAKIVVKFKPQKSLRDEVDPK